MYTTETTLQCIERSVLSKFRANHAPLFHCPFYGRVPGTFRNRRTSTCLVTYMLSTYSLQGLHHGALPEIFADKHALAVRQRKMRKAKR